MPIELSVLNPTQVASPSSFEVLVGAPAKRMVIFSGIAIPQFWTNHDEEPRTEEILVHLNYYVEELENAVVHVGLAAITNDETNFSFVLFSAKVYADSTGELILSVPAAILGEETLINRFGYQIVAHVRKMAARISGTIILPREILDIEGMSKADVASLFVITANRIDKPAGASFPSLTPVAIGQIHAVRPGRINLIDYAIDACPLHTPLQVDVLLAGRLAIPGVAIGQVSGARPVTLTNVQPDANDIFFSVGRLPPVP